MPNLEEVYRRMQDKKRERREIDRAFKDELAQHPRYPQLIEELQKLREEKKSIEGQVYAAANADAVKLDVLKLDIKTDRQMLSDIALNLYADGKTVEIVDENNTRWVPSFSVAFKKEESSMEETSPERVEPAPLPEPEFAP